MRAECAQAVARATLRRGGLPVEEEIDYHDVGDLEEDEIADEEEIGSNSDGVEQMFNCSSLMAMAYGSCEAACQRFLSAVSPLL